MHFELYTEQKYEIYSLVNSKIIVRKLNWFISSVEAEYLTCNK